MVRLNWTSHALNKIEDICHYIDGYDVDSSKKFMKSVKIELDSLKQFPKIGRIVPERNNENLREIFIKKFRFLYIYEKNEITILTILHFKQDFTLR